MRFRPTTPDENFPILRLVSDGGGWELGCTPVIYGRRVRLGRVGAMAVELDYCAGADPTLALEIVLLVSEILYPVAETELTPAFIKQTFPGWTRRPIDRDPTCLTRLRELAYDNQIIA